jgi:hypothetical protein
MNFEHFIILLQIATGAALALVLIVCFVKNHKIILMREGVVTHILFTYNFYKQ